MGPLVSIFNELCNVEAVAKSATNKSVVKLDEEGKLILDSVTVDFVNMRRFLGKSLRLLSAAHSNLLLKRKLSLRPYIDHKFHHLTKESNPVTTLLLGEDLEQKISEVTKVLEVAKRLTFTRTPRGRHFRGRRPYYRQPYNNHSQYRERQFDRPNFRCESMRGRPSRSFQNFRGSRRPRFQNPRGRSGYRGRRAQR